MFGECGYSVVSWSRRLAVSESVWVGKNLPAKCGGRYCEVLGYAGIKKIPAM